MVGSAHSEWLRSLRARQYGSRALKERRLQGESEDQPLDYWKRLVGTPSRLGGVTKKEGVLPAHKYSMQQFDVLPFQVRRMDGCSGTQEGKGVPEHVLHPW